MCSYAEHNPKLDFLDCLKAVAERVGAKARTIERDYGRNTNLRRQEDG